MPPMKMDLMYTIDNQLSANKLVYPAFALLGVIWGTNFIFMKWSW